MADTNVIESLTDKSLNATFTIDGRQMTVADLVAAYSTAKTIEQRLKDTESKLQTTVESVRRMLNGGDEQTARTMLSALGYSGDQIEAYVAAHFKNDPAKSKVKARPDEPMPEIDPEDEEDDVDTDEDALLKRIADLEARLAAAEQTGDSMVLKRISDAIDNEVRTRLSNDPYVKALIENRARVDKTVDAGKIIGVLADRARADTTRRLKERRKVNGSFDETWIPGEVEKAVSAVIDEQRLVFSDPRFIGRSPDIVAAEDEAKRAKPVEPPTFSDEKPDIDLSEAADNFLADGLLRAARSIDVVTNA